MGLGPGGGGRFKFSVLGGQSVRREDKLPRHTMARAVLAFRAMTCLNDPEEIHPLWLPSRARFLLPRLKPWIYSRPAIFQVASLIVPE